MSFFKSECLTLTEAEVFGICDQQNGRAFIDTIKENDWLATVKNPSKCELHFYAIDNCIVYERPEGGRASSCDAAIKASANKLLFIELKNRKYSGWLSKGIEQLKNTVEFYKQHEPNVVNEVECYLSNALRPKVPSSRTRETAQLKEDFKQTTGASLQIKTTINI